ncbi:MAG: hypothetical protein JWR86_2376 [Enterovirga sp.]|nr:hypothetical protein [Enterovirga sp.]
MDAAGRVRPHARALGRPRRHIGAGPVDGSAAGEHDDGRRRVNLLKEWLVLPPGRVNHVAFGTFCHVAAALRDTGLRRWTGPFDWIFSTPGLLADCLEDDFARLLDPAELTSVPPEGLTNGARRQCRHPFYEERHGLPTIFNHHDPAGNAGDMRALHRAVRRLRLALGTDRRNQLYMMSERPWDEADLERLAALVAARPSRDELIVITAVVAGERGWSERVRELAGLPVRDVELRVGGRSRGTGFPDPADDAVLRRALVELAGPAAVNASRHRSG